ncbi:oligosaccharide flippase family protein [Mycolicibacterium baixiangningiae]|uniref:oligosaccharide flippase family protein n=1 Tax=Mycolicibacterium baixiangningiae TaxID=2761578 RepID=UPI0018D15B66|nr:oligosaccharide flippase family protein [Mycolicibacterium baixiangningiae]
MDSESAGPAPSGRDVTVGPPSFARVVRRGAGISVFTLALTQIISLVSIIWLARLLSPEEVGIYTAGTVLSAVLISLSEGGLRLALVQREHDVEDCADTVFWATAGTGLVGSLAALAAAPLLGYIFGNDLVTAVAVSTSGLLLLESLTHVPDGLMQRRFNFLKKLVVDPSRTIAYSAVAIGLAASGFGVWSMVLGQYAAAVVWLIGSWSLARWRPGRGRPSVRLWRELARFAYPLAIANVVSHVRETVQTAATGRRLGESALGNYRYGLRFGTLAGIAVFEVGSYVLFPAFSRMAADSERLQAAFLRALRWIWFAATPVAALIVALGEQTVVVVLGEPWRDAGLFLVALSGSGLGLALQAVANEAVKAAGRPALLHWTSAIELVLGVGLVIAFVPFGLVGVGVAISVTEVVSGIVLLALAKSVVGYRMWPVVRMLALPPIAAITGMAVVFGLTPVVGEPTEMPTIAALGLLAGLALTLLAVYLTVLAVVDRPLFAALRDKLTSRS